jgi:hypothetical protein
MKRSLFHILGCAVLVLGFSAAAPVWAQETIVYDGTNPAVLQNIGVTNPNSLGPSGSDTGKSNSLTGNTITLQAGGTVALVRGGLNFNDDDAVSGNIVNIEGGVAENTTVMGGHHWTLSSGANAVATNNAVNISGGEVAIPYLNSENVIGGYANSFSGNATATANRLYIEGGLIHPFSGSSGAGGLYGGLARGPGAGAVIEASGNTVAISAGDLREIAVVCGGCAVARSNATTSTLIASNNLVSITGTPVFSSAGPPHLHLDILGGGTSDSTGRISGTSVGNVLDFRTSGVAITGTVDAFQHMAFMLPTSLANGDTMLSTSGTDLTGVSVIEVGFDNPAAPPAIALGNRYTLIAGVYDAPFVPVFTPVTGTLGGLPYTVSVVPTGLAPGWSDLVLEFTDIAGASVAVTGPVAGAAPNTVVTTCGANATCSAVTWAPAHNPFQAGTQYTAEVTLTADVGFTFTGLTTARINGNAATVTNNTGNTVTLSYQFAVAIATASIAVTEPVTGAAPNAIVTSCGNGTDFTCGAVTWTPNDNPFADGTQYTAEVTLTANGGFTFTGLTSATINGNAANVIGNTGGLVRLSYQFTTAATAINTASIDVTGPATGATPNATVTSCGTDFVCSAVTWAPNDNPFQAGTQYTATITLTANAGYTFTGLAATAATINGTSATVTNNTGSTVTLSYQFTATGAPPTVRANLASIPVLNPAMLVLLALALGGLAFRQGRRSA